MQISICIVNWNVCALLDSCLKSIYLNPPKASFEIIVVDNASNDDSVAMVESKYPLVHLIVNKDNQGFSKGNNSAIKHSLGKYVLLLNPDTEVEHGAIDILFDYLESNVQAAVAAPKLLNYDRSLQRSILGFPTLQAMIMRQLFVEQIWPGNPFTKRYLASGHDYDVAGEVDQPMGACLMIRRSAVEKAGYFDESSFMFFDEVDLCYRIKRSGAKIVYLPASQIVHHGGSSVRKWGDLNLSKHWSRSRNIFFLKKIGRAHV